MVDIQKEQEKVSASKFLCQKTIYSEDQFQTTDMDENWVKISIWFLSSDCRTDHLKRHRCDVKNGQLVIIFTKWMYKKMN